MFLNIIVMASAIVAAAILGYWVQDRDPPIVDYTAIMAPPAPHPGDKIRILHTLDRKRLCHVKLQQVVYDQDNTRIVEPLQEYIVEAGDLGQGSFTTTFQLTPETAYGEATYQAVRAYYCNPLQAMVDWPIIVRGPTVKFRVEPRK